MRAFCVVLLCAASAACFRPEIGVVECGENRECPPSKVCDVDNFCKAPSDLIGDVGPDAGRGVTEPGFDVSHLPLSVEDFGDLDLQIVGTVEVDTDANILGAPFNLNLESMGQVDGGPQTSVLIVKRFEITAGSTLRVRGARGLIIVSEQSPVIAGTIDANAEGTTPGPGAGVRGRGNDGLASGEFFGGGGGGAFETNGGRGGATESAMGGSGGELVGDAELSLLDSGSPGGGAAIGVACERSGGGGGGSIQVSTPGSITVSGLIAAGGGGGEPGGPCPGGRGGPGGGGGSGGAIYLQAELITIDGALIANGGGGGGGGGDDNGQDGDPGIDGGQIAEFALGGDGGDDSGDGGTGGGLGRLPTDGGDARTSNGGGGGGGGAAGRIAVEGAMTVAGDALVSPAATAVQ